MGSHRGNVEAQILLRLGGLHHHGAFTRERASPGDTRIGTLDRLDGNDHAAPDHHRLPHIAGAEGARYPDAHLRVGALLGAQLARPHRPRGSY